MQVNDVILNIMKAIEQGIVAINSVIGVGSHMGSSALSNTLLFFHVI